MPTPKGKTTITVYVEPHIRDEVNKLAKLHHRSANTLINVLIEKALKQARQKGELH